MNTKFECSIYIYFHVWLPTFCNSIMSSPSSLSQKHFLEAPVYRCIPQSLQPPHFSKHIDSKREEVKEDVDSSLIHRSLIHESLIDVSLREKMYGFSDMCTEYIPKPNFVREHEPRLIGQALCSWSEKARDEKHGCWTKIDERRYGTLSDKKMSIDLIHVYSLERKTLIIHEKEFDAVLKQEKRCFQCNHNCKRGYYNRDLELVLCTTCFDM